MSDIQGTKTTIGRQPREQLQDELSRGLDYVHHDTPVRHQFGTTFEAPVAVEAINPNDTDGFVGSSDSPARADHRHGWDTGATPWTNIGAFSNSWVNFAAGTDPARYRKIGDMVFVDGTIKDGSVRAFTAFTLPVGFRPTGGKNFAVATGTGYGRVTISTAGIVQVFTGGNAFVALEGTCFST